MSIEVLIDAFRLPPQALVSHRIPKKLLVEQGATTAADKRLINDTVDDEVVGNENLVAQMVWEGANKNDAKQIGICHEYVLVYARNREALPREWSLKKEGVDPQRGEATP